MKNKLISQEVQDKVIEIYKSGLSIRDTRDYYNKEFNDVLTFHNVRTIVKDLLHKNKDLKELNDSVKEQMTYETTDKEYIFYKSEQDDNGERIKKGYKISIDVVDSIFKDYAKHWNNLSQDEIIKKYSLKPEVWNLIKSRLRLYKTSHTISPATLAKCSDKELDEHIEEAIDEHIQDRYTTRFTETFEKKKHKDYVEKSKILANISNTLAHIDEYLLNYKPKEINFDIPKVDNNEELAVLFSDIHLGKMNTEQVLQRIEDMGNDLCQREERIIHLISLWDLYENLVKWWMHIWQVESMDWPFWFDLLMKGVEALEWLILKLYSKWKDIKLYGLWGNHWDLTNLKQGRWGGIGEHIAFEMIKRWLQNIAVEINILKDTWNVIDIDDIRYILHHWNDGIAKKGIRKSKEILWEFWDSNKFNIIATGDLHHLETNNTSDKSLSLIVPALAGRNEFDSKLWLSSNPWYVVVKKKCDNNTSVEINNLT